MYIFYTQNVLHMFACLNMIISFFFFNFYTDPTTCFIEKEEDNIGTAINWDIEKLD